MPAQKDSLDYHYQMTKGRLAETIIEELFIDCGYEVHRFGMENMIPGLVRKLRYNDTDTSKHIKKMPDFVMHKGGRITFVEVKYRSDGHYDLTCLEKDGSNAYPYNDCLLVILSREKIKAVSVNELRFKNAQITPDCDHYLSDRSEFTLDPEKIKSYEKIVRMFFGNLPSKFHE